MEYRVEIDRLVRHYLFGAREDKVQGQELNESEKRTLSEFGHVRDYLLKHRSEYQQVFKGFSRPSITSSPDGERILIIDSSKMVIKRFESDCWIDELESPSNASAYGVFSGDGKKIAIADPVSGSIDIWQCEGGHWLKEKFLSFTPKVRSLICLNSDGNRLALGGGHDNVRIWIFRNGAWAFEQELQTRDAGSLVFSLDGKRLLIGKYGDVTRFNENRLDVWRLNDFGWGCERVIEGISSVESGFALSRKEEETVVVGVGASEVHIVDLKSGDLRQVLRHPQYAQRGPDVAGGNIFFSPDESRMATIFNDKVLIWFFEHNHWILEDEITQSELSITNVLFSVDGQKLMLGFGASSDSWREILETRFLDRGHWNNRFWLGHDDISPDGKNSLSIIWHNGWFRDYWTASIKRVGQESSFAAEDYALPKLMLLLLINRDGGAAFNDSRPHLWAIFNQLSEGTRYGLLLDYNINPPASWQRRVANTAIDLSAVLAGGYMIYRKFFK